MKVQVILKQMLEQFVKHQLGVLVQHFKNEMKEQLVSSELSLGHSPLDEEPEKIVEKVDEAEKIFKKDNTDKEEKHIRKVDAQDMNKKACVGEAFKKLR